MSERLTKRDENGNAYYDWGCLNRNHWVLGRHVERLAQYEDIGLTPDEITDMIYRFEAFLCEMTGGRMSKSNYTLDAMISAANEYQQSLCDECWDRSELAKYYELEHEKRLVVLPCKVGDTVYAIHNIPNSDKKVMVEVQADLFFIVLSTCEGRFGKTVFLSREEAEKVLEAKRRGGKRMNKTKIEWADYTWNPVTGCLHGCEYCYARRMANRFSMKFAPLIGEFDGHLYELKDDIMMDLNSPVVENGQIQPYPAGFAPTFHRYRLDEPQKLKKPSKIFVCSMADLFGDWVPDEWIQEVFKACKAAPWHKYLFLTKNPKRYAQEDLIRSCLVDQDYYSCSYFGVSVTNQQMMDEAMDQFSKINIACPKFISIEPLLNDIQIKDIWKLKWVIIGQQTGPGAIPPKPEWVQSIIDQCQAAGVPVFVKSPLYEKFPIQEWPEGLK